VAFERYRGAIGTTRPARATRLAARRYVNGVSRWRDRVYGTGRYGRCRGHGKLPPHTRTPLKTAPYKLLLHGDLWWLGGFWYAEFSGEIKKWFESWLYMDRAVERAGLYAVTALSVAEFALLPKGGFQLGLCDCIWYWLYVKVFMWKVFKAVFADIGECSPCDFV